MMYFFVSLPAGQAGLWLSFSCQVAHKVKLLIFLGLNEDNVIFRKTNNP